MLSTVGTRLPALAQRALRWTPAWALNLALAAYLALLSFVMRFLPLVFRGRWGKIPTSLPRPSSRIMHSAANGPMQVLVWNEGQSGTPLVCLHGLNANPWLWARMVGTLLQGHPKWGPVYSLAMPGHGEIARQDVPVDLDHTVECIADVLRQFKVTECYVAGHSWGGKVALYMAAVMPDMVKAVVLCDPIVPQCPSPVAMAVPFVVQFTFWPERRSFPSQAALEAGRRCLLHMGRSADSLELQLWRGMYRAMPTGEYQPFVADKTLWAIVEQAIMVDITGRLSAVKCPVLAIRPDLSVAAWPLAMRHLQKLPQFTLRHVAGDHAFVHSNPQDTADLVASFLTRVQAASVKSKLNPNAVLFVPVKAK